MPTLTNPRPDEILAEEFRCRHDRAALSELVGRYDDRIYAFLLRLLRDPHKAQEASQDAFLRMLRALDGYRAELPFRPWLYRIALNAARTLRSREVEQARRERAAALAHPEEDPALNPAERAIQKEVESFVNDLPDPQKEAILLHYFQGLSHSEVASALQIPAGTAATRIHGGLESLRGRLAPLGLAVAAVALGELLGAASAEAAPSSIRAAVLSALAADTSGPSTSAGVLKGLSVANAKLSSTIALAVLCLSGGAVVGYAVRSSQERQEPETAVAIHRSPAAAATSPADPGERPLSPPSTPPPAAPGRTPSAPAGIPVQKKTKLQKVAAWVARMLQASGKGVKNQFRVSPAETAEFMALMSDPEINAMMENAGGLNWEHSGEFMVALVEELVPDLTDLQKIRLANALAIIVARKEALSEQSSSMVERKLLEIRQGREFFDQLSGILTPDQQAGLSPLERFGVGSVPARILRPGSQDGTVSEVLDFWSKNLATLSDEDRGRLAGTAADYAARLRAIQADLESRYGAPFLKLLSDPPTTRLAATFGPEDVPGRSTPSASAPTASLDPKLTQKQIDAYERLLEMERDERQVLAALVPSQAEAIRNAEAYVPLLESGPKPGFLGVSGANAPGGGAQVLQVVENTAASGAGLRAGDVIVEVNGEPVADYSALVAKVREAGQGSELRIKVRREGVEFVQGVRLSAAPK